MMKLRNHFPGLLSLNGTVPASLSRTSQSRGLQAKLENLPTVFFFILKKLLKSLSDGQGHSPI